ncbi:hypothetical protein H8958_003488 [Nasalis larvatus]
MTILLPEDEEESPQVSTSEYPLREVVDDKVLGPSAPGVDPSPTCRSLCWKRKREWLDQSEEEPEKELAPEPEETWVVETLFGLKKADFTRRRISFADRRCIFSILENEELEMFTEIVDISPYGQDG